MPIMFNTLLREAGFPLCDVRLVRHQDSRADKGFTPYELWVNDPPRFEDYQSVQRRDDKRFRAPYWAVFLGTPDGKTMFVGIYDAKYEGRLAQDQPKPHIKGGVDKAGSCDVYDLTLKPALKDLIGKLFIDWGKGRGKGRGGEQAWAQYADRQDMPITELRA